MFKFLILQFAFSCSLTEDPTTPAPNHITHTPPTTVPTHTPPTSPPTHTPPTTAPTHTPPTTYHPTTAGPSTSSSLPTTSPDPYVCPVGWVQSTEGCYLFHHTASGLTWRQGQEECEKLGGYLAEIKSQEQQDFLMSIANLEEILIDTKSWQIGLSDQGHEGRWMWQHSADDVDYEAWAWDQPDGTNIADDCACMDQESGYQWVAVRCDDPEEPGSPICQKDVYDPTTPTPSTTPATTTPEPKIELHVDGGDVSFPPGSGNVYANNRNGYFGPVCDDGWGQNEANVVCRQLGYSYGNLHTGSYYGTVSTSDFAMDDVVCSGTEQYLQDCSYSTTDNCDIYDGAGVYCYN